MTREEKLRKLNELQLESAELVRELSEEELQETPQWPPKSFYWWYHAMTGLILGGVGAVTSLLLNVVGSMITGQNALQLIRVYLTFPMGEAAFKTEGSVALLLGVGLYIMTGAAIGVIFEIIMAKYFVQKTAMTRLLVATGVGLGIWIINFYLILSWLQPMVTGGNWIMTMIPFWVAALTHLVFAWTMVGIGEWGHFEATDYRRQAMVQNSANQ